MSSTWSDRTGRGCVANLAALVALAVAFLAGHRIERFAGSSK